MSAFDILNDLLGYGLDVAEASWQVLSVLCLLGLAFLLGGHLLAIRGHAFIHRAIFYGMTAILAFSALNVVALLFAVSQDRSFGFPLIIFVATMMAPIGLSAIGVLLTRYSRFPLPRQR